MMIWNLPLTDNLHNMAVEQSGGIGHERLWVWMDKHSLSQERAAVALGASRRMHNCYLTGAKPLPRTVWPACLGWETTCKKPRRTKHNANSAAHASRLSLCNFQKCCGN